MLNLRFLVNDDVDVGYKMAALFHQLRTLFFFLGEEAEFMLFNF